MYRSLLIANVFKLINLILIIFIIAYLFKKYALDMIKGEIAEEKLKVRTLKKSISDSKDQVEALDLDIKQQGAESKQLFNKVKKWAIIVAEDDNAEEAELKENLKKAESRAMVQVEYVQEDTAINAVVPLAIKKIEEEACSEFADIKNRKRFLKEALAVLGRKT
jgi:hypothetical protein